MLIAICLNGLITLFVLWLAYGFWRWRCRLTKLAQRLEHSEGSLKLGTQQARYELAYRRVQLAQTQLMWVEYLSTWQQRSRQVKQLQQLVRLLQLVMLIRRPSKRSRKRSRPKNA